MTIFRLRYVKAYSDRHGKRRHYFRRPGCISVALPGDPGSREFMEAYQAALAGAPKREIGAEKTIPGSMSDLIVRYYRSRAFLNLKPKTQSTYRGELERFRKEHGKWLVRGFRRRHLVAILDAKTQGAQENLRKVLRAILTLAVELEWIPLHPMTGMRRSRKPLKGFAPWDEADIAKFEETWPTGSRERLALALLLYTGQRRSDVVKMGRQHVKDGMIRVRQQKTDTELFIPLHSALKAEIAAAPVEHLTFLTTAYGKPFSPAGFTNWFVESAGKAGLTGKTPHGLRKAAARRMAEAGCTPSQLMAVTGHKNLSEVTLYTASADQARLAAEAIARTEVSTKSKPVDNSGEKSSQNNG